MAPFWEKRVPAPDLKEMFVCMGYITAMMYGKLGSHLDIPIDVIVRK